MQAADPADAVAAEAVRRATFEAGTDVDAFRLSRSVDVDEWLSRRVGGGGGGGGGGESGGGENEPPREAAADAMHPSELRAVVDSSRADAAASAGARTTNSALALSSRVAILVEPLANINLRTSVVRREAADTSLGLQLFTPTPTWSNPHPMGVRITKVIGGSPCERAGGLETGDVILEINGESVIDAGRSLFSRLCLLCCLLCALL